MKGAADDGSGAVARIDSERLHVFPVLYQAAMLEQMAFFAAADRIAAQFSSGMLPLSSGAASEHIYEYIRSSSERLTEEERRSVYARAFGTAGGDVPAVEPNDGFHELWIRFLASVQEARHSSSGKQARSPEGVHDSGRALVINLTARSDGVAPQARALQSQLEVVTAVLSLPEVLEHYDAKDPWQLVDPKSSCQHERTLGRAGAEILRCLADAASVFSRPYCEESVRGTVAGCLGEPVESWLAASGRTAG